MLSILIPTFNDDLTSLVQNLCREIQSLDAPVEVIIGDDHSDQQNNYESLKKLGPVSLLRNEQNIGRTATRQHLAQNAKFNTLLFLDADVLPDHTDFLARYLAHLGQGSVLFGGVCYTDQKPKKQLLLRWVYGKKREAKTAEQRRGNPHFIISQNLMIDRDIFLSVNNPKIQRYGWDNVFSYQLYHKDIDVLHIDNPVLHMGLESCENYLEKVDQAMKTLVWAQKQGMISEDFTSIQKLYCKLSTLRLAGLLEQLVRPCLPLMRYQLASRFPSVRVLDFYKFYYFSFYKNKV
jgi:glycosyltransferase involved in cell wall biosynthesis